MEPFYPVRLPSGGTAEVVIRLSNEEDEKYIKAEDIITKFDETGCLTLRICLPTTPVGESILDDLIANKILDPTSKTKLDKKLLERTNKFLIHTQIKDLEELRLFYSRIGCKVSSSGRQTFVSLRK
jgi:hypothetical protein